MHDDAEVEPLTERSAAAMAAGEHAVLGISPFNSYFSQERIAALVGWASSRFDATHLFVPDEPTRYTLEALGYSEARARKKSRRQCNWLRNKMRKALAALGIADDAAERMIVGWTELSENSAYVMRHRACLDRYECDRSFREACLESVRWALAPQADGPLDSCALDTASRYVLAEIPLFVDSVGVFGVRSSVFCYHQVIPFVTRLFQRELAVEPVAMQGYVRVDVAGWPRRGRTRPGERPADSERSPLGPRGSGSQRNPEDRSLLE